MKDFVATLTKGARWAIGIVLFFIASNVSKLVYPISILATVIAVAALLVFLLACKAVPSAPAAKQKAAASEAAKKQAAIDERRAEAERKDAELKAEMAEFDRTHGRIKTKLVGVTFNNEDGTSRQAVLKELSASGDSSGLSMDVYDFNGEPAIRVLYEGMCCGNLPKSIVPEVLAVEDNITSCSLNVETFTPDDVDDDYDDDGNIKHANKTKLYRADLTIVYNKK